MTFSAFDQFLQYLRVAKNSSEHTIRNYGIDLKAFGTFLEKEKIADFQQVDRRVLRGFLAHLSTQSQSKKTIARRLSSLRTFFKYAFSQKIISSNPAEDLESPKIEKHVPTSLTYDHVKQLLEQPDVNTYLGLRDRTIMELFYKFRTACQRAGGLE